MSSPNAAHRINAALLRVAELRGLNVDGIHSTLPATSTSETPLVHLARAAAATPRLFADPVVRSAARELHLDAAWDGTLTRLIQRSPLLRGDAPRTGGVTSSNLPPIDGAYLPEEGEDAYQQGLLLKTFDELPDLVGLWVRDRDVAVYHASPGGFRLVAEDPVRWIEALVDIVDSGADPDLIRRRLKDYVQAAGAKRYRLVMASGALRDAMEVVSARADGRASLLERRLWALLDALGDEASARLQVSTPPPGLDHLEAVFSGDAAALRAKLPAVLAVIEGKRHHLSVLLEDDGGQLSVLDELSPERMVDCFERIASGKARGERVSLDISTSERGRLDAGAPQSCVLDDCAGVPAIKARLEAFADATGAKRFAATITSADGSIDEREGMAHKQLLRSASAFQSTLRAGGRVVVQVASEAETPVTGSAAEPLLL